MPFTYFVIRGISYFPAHIMLNKIEGLRYLTHVYIIPKNKNRSVHEDHVSIKRSSRSDFISAALVKLFYERSVTAAPVLRIVLLPAENDSCFLALGC